MVLASGEISLWDGPINLQDGTEFVAEGADSLPTKRSGTCRSFLRAWKDQASKATKIYREWQPATPRCLLSIKVHMRVDINEIKKYFGEVRANDGINLCLEGGHIYGISRGERCWKKHADENSVRISKSGQR